MSNDENDSIRKAAQMTVTFCCLYTVTFVNVLIAKKRLLREARLVNAEFDRYTSPGMHSADRLQANFLEWSPIFLGLVWSLGATDNLISVSLVAAWVYLGLRALYIFLVLQHGVSTNGMNRALWISTFPAYACLLCMFVHSISVLFF